MNNESIEKEFNRYALKLLKKEAQEANHIKIFMGKRTLWMIAIILFLFTLTLGIIVGVSITPKSVVSAQRNSALEKYCEFTRW